MTAEPRMEDLLASIRRAIHDDIGEAPPMARQSRDVVFKGNMNELRLKPGDQASPAMIEIQELREKIERTRADEILDSEAGARGARPGGRLAPPALRPSLSEADFRAAETGIWDDEAPATLLSAEAETAAGNAFSQLAQSLFNRQMGSQSLEAMTREMLRGLLKQWLDTNLPSLVEKLVREEIERVARRGR